MGDSSIHVETTGLADFAGHVRFYAEQVDPVDVARSRQSFSAGITFGATNASEAVLRAKENYAKALDHSLTNLTRFVEAARILADAAEQAAKDFRAVDDQSERSIHTISRMLSLAAGRTQTASDVRYDGEVS